MTTDQKIDLILDKVKTLETLVAAILPYRRLPEELKRKVDMLGGGVTVAYRGARAQEALEMFVKCVTMPGSKKRKANFPRETLDQWDMKTNTATIRRIVPLSHLVARLSALKSFRPAGADEMSSRDNAEKAIAESGLVVSNLAELRLKRHSTVPVVLEAELYAQFTGKVEHVEQEEEELEEDEIQDEEPIKPYVPPTDYKAKISGFGRDVPEHVDEQEETLPVPDAVLKKKAKVRGFREEPTTVDTVDGDLTEPGDLTTTTPTVFDPTLPEDDDTDGWGEDEQPEGDPFADFALSGQQQRESEKKLKKVVDLSWGEE
jgi:hypothetical protein